MYLNKKDPSALSLGQKHAVCMHFLCFACVHIGKAGNQGYIWSKVCFGYYRTENDLKYFIDHAPLIFKLVAVPKK